MDTPRPSPRTNRTRRVPQATGAARTAPREQPHRFEAFHSREEFEARAGEVGKDPRAWPLPGAGTLEFVLAAAPQRAALPHLPLLPPAPSAVLKNLRAQLLKVLAPEAKARLVVSMLGPEQLGAARGVQLHAVKDLLGLVERGGKRAQHRAAGVAVVAALATAVSDAGAPHACKVTALDPAWDAVALLPADAREDALELLGWAQLRFTAANPTGRYRLDLADPEQRETALLLVSPRPPPPPSSRTNRTRRVPHPVLIGHAASLSQVEAKKLQHSFEERCRDFQVGRAWRRARPRRSAAGGTRALPRARRAAFDSAKWQSRRLQGVHGARLRAAARRGARAHARPRPWTRTCCARSLPPCPPPSVLSGHAASLTPY